MPFVPHCQWKKRSKKRFQRVPGRGKCGLKITRITQEHVIPFDMSGILCLIIIRLVLIVTIVSWEFFSSRDLILNCFRRVGIVVYAVSAHNMFRHFNVMLASPERHIHARICYRATNTSASSTDESRSDPSARDQANSFSGQSTYETLKQVVFYKVSHKEP